MDDENVPTWVPPIPRTCWTCLRFDTRPHHVQLRAPSHHLTCCPKACGAHWGPR